MNKLEELQDDLNYAKENYEAVIRFTSDKKAIEKAMLLVTMSEKALEDYLKENENELSKTLYN